MKLGVGRVDSPELVLFLRDVRLAEGHSPKVSSGMSLCFSGLHRRCRPR